MSYSTIDNDVVLASEKDLTERVVQVINMVLKSNHYGDNCVSVLTKYINTNNSINDLIDNKYKVSDENSKGSKNMSAEDLSEKIRLINEQKDNILDNLLIPCFNNFKDNYDKMSNKELQQAMITIIYLRAKLHNSTKIVQNLQRKEVAENNNQKAPRAQDTTFPLWKHCMKEGKEILENNLNQQLGGKKTTKGRASDPSDSDLLAFDPNDLFDEGNFGENVCSPIAKPNQTLGNNTTTQVYSEGRFYSGVNDHNLDDENLDNLLLVNPSASHMSDTESDDDEALVLSSRYHKSAKAYNDAILNSKQNPSLDVDFKVLKKDKRKHRDALEFYKRSSKMLKGLTGGLVYDDHNASGLPTKTTFSTAQQQRRDGGNQSPHF